MELYKGRRVLTAVDALAVKIAVAEQHERRAFVDIPFHERESLRRRERADAERESALLVERFLSEGHGITRMRERTALVRKAQEFGRKGAICAIQKPIIPVKGGAISYCAPRSRG